jgi:outer membrane protein assembly factor BamE
MEIRQGNLISPEMRERIRVGMSRQQISTALGSPLISDVYHANRWDYIYSLEEKGKLVEQHRLTVYFKGDFVVRIDDGDAPVVKDPVAPTGAVQ